MEYFYDKDKLKRKKIAHYVWVYHDISVILKREIINKYRMKE